MNKLKITLLFLLGGSAAWGLGQSTTQLLAGKIINGSGTLNINSSGAVTVPNSTGTIALTNGNVATATALAADPADCGSNTFANAINASGTLSCTSVPNAALGTMSAHTFKGNNTSSTAVPVDETVTQATAELNAMVGDSGSGGTKGLVPAPAAGDAAAAKFLKADGTWQASAGGTVTSVTFTGDGTVLSSTPSSAVTTTGTVTAALATAAKNTYLGGPLSGSAAAPTYKAFTPVTIQKFTTTGTQTGWLFTISTSSTVAVGDTYKENNGAGNTYTVLGSLSAQTGQVLFMSGSSSAATTPLARQTGAGTSSISFTAQTALATYTAPTNPAPLYLRVRMVGGGGSGGGSGASGTTGHDGTNTYFGAVLLDATTGGGAIIGSPPTGGSGGAGFLGTGPIGQTITGGSGGGSSFNTAANPRPGGSGASSPFGGGGIGAMSANGIAAVANSGSGGSGGGIDSTTSIFTGAAGGAGGYVDAIISSPSTTYPYVIGTGGSAGSAGTGGFPGGAGGSGLIIVEEHYQ